MGHAPALTVNDPVQDPSPPPMAHASTGEPIVQLTDLVKSFGNVHALRGLTMELPPGPVGLLGPNGAGKTTLISILLGLLEPTSGSALVTGLRPNRRSSRLEIRNRVGYMPESDCLLPGMTAVEIVSSLGRLTGLSRQDSITRAHEVLDYVELDEARYRALDGYSTGMKQRLKLAQCLVHDPEFLLLDEPTNGLDPAGRRHMLSLVEDLGRNQGKNVLLCSHLLPDVERTCDNVVVLVKGQAILQGSIAELTAAEAKQLDVRVEGDPGGLTAALLRTGYSVTPGQAPDRLVVTLPPGVDDADGLCGLAAELGVALSGIDQVRSTLEDVFLQVVDSNEQRPAEVAP